MKSVRFRSRVLVFAVSALLAGSAWAINVTDADIPRSLPEKGGVGIDWEDPATFSELKRSGNQWQAKRGDWVRELAGHMQDQVAKSLPEGQQFNIHITDIDRAGDYEPGRGPSADEIRVLKDIYPPRIKFDYVRTGADGQVLDQGSEDLRDMAFLSQPGMRYETDNLAYEKRMFNAWVSKEVHTAGR